MSAALLAKLIEAGTPAELVGEVAMELARAEAAAKAIETKRAYDREYQRERRRTTSYDSNDVADKGSLEVSPPAPPLPNPSKSSPLNPPKLLEEKRRAVASCLRQAFPSPEGVDDEQWLAFRKQRKKALNDRSYALLTNKLAQLSAKGHDPGILIDLAIERGWETVFEPKEFGGKAVEPLPAKLAPEAEIASLKTLIGHYSRAGRFDDIREARRRIAELEGGQGPPIIQQVARSVRAA